MEDVQTVGNFPARLSMASRVRLGHRNGDHASKPVFSLKALVQRSWLRPFRPCGAPWERYYADDAKEVTNLPVLERAPSSNSSCKMQAVGFHATSTTDLCRNSGRLLSLRLKLSSILISLSEASVIASCALREIDGK
jgi:hypothetical protein